MTTTGKTLVTGNTYPHRVELRGMGGEWDAEKKGWWLPADRAVEAQRLVGPAVKAAPKARTVPRGWRPCGYPGCNPGYCDECDGKGAGRGGGW